MPESHETSKSYSASRQTDNRFFEAVAMETDELQYLNLDKMKDSSCFLSMIYMCLTSSPRQHEK